MRNAGWAAGKREGDSLRGEWSSIRTRRTSFVLFTLVLLVVSPVAPAVLANSPVTIVITESLDQPDVTIEPGTTVTWVNEDSQRHRIRSQSGPIEFDSGNLDPGQAFSMVFDTVGTYSYLDDRNDQNTAYFGTVDVVAQTEPNPPPPPNGAVSVDVVNRSYSPASISIDPGTTVIWGNIDDRPHTVTARNGSFDSGIFDTGGSYSRTFSEAGTFEYFCTLHPDMVGVVVVGGAAEPPPAPTPPPPDPTPPPPPPPAGDVTIFDNGFTPSTLTIVTGTNIIWSNTGALPHTVTDRNGAFDSGILMNGASYQRTFNSPGTYSYFCSIHPEMTATITVTGELQAPAPEPPPNPPPSESPPPPTSGDVRIVDNAFSPTTKRVNVGGSITWSNEGDLPHTVTGRTSTFDSGILMPGQTFTTKFETAGTYEYFCTLHAGMRASIVVTDAHGNALPAAPVDADAPPDEQLSGSAALSDVSIVDNAFRPIDVVVAAGSSVTWVNTGAIPHTVTGRATSFDSGILMPGEGYRRTFKTPGQYEYFCTLHPEMVGTVTVTEGGTPTGPSGEDGVFSSSEVEQPDNDTGGDQPDVQIEEVAVVDVAFDPEVLTVRTGTLVVWTNDGELPHTVTAANLFDSGVMARGETFERVFDESGTFDYVCTLHPGMAGTVVVQDVVLGEATSTAVMPQSSSSAGSSSLSAFILAGGLALAGTGIALAMGIFAKAVREGRQV